MQKLKVVLVVLIFAAVGLISVSRDSIAAHRIGEVWTQSEAGAALFHKALVGGLHELGYIEGQNIILSTRYADGDTSRLSPLLNELINEHVDILFVSEAAVAPAKKLTSGIPIVCATMGDPVSAGLVVSLSRPGGNLTGVSWQSVDSAPKRLELALELRPKVSRLAVMYGRGNREAQLEAEIVTQAARKANIAVFSYEVQRLPDVLAAFTDMARHKPHVLHVVDTGVTFGMRREIATSALELRVPMISEGRSFAEAAVCSRMVPV